ncbi:MAG: DNA primase small subunit PriS [Candidatus Bathyarchaeota archaeon]
MKEKREFGFAMFEGWMLRHKSFEHDNDLIHFLRDSVPSDVYYSSAYYRHPEAEMDKKGWLGADLVFDIDSDHIPTACEKFHDRWICQTCGMVGKAVTPRTCPACKGEKFQTNTWPCEVCLDSAKNESRKLLDFLMQDFGLSNNYVHVFFSGHRGYHIHVETEFIRTLDSIARKEIVDYVCGLGLNIAPYHLTKKDQRKKTSFPLILHNKSGWHRRVTQGIQNFIRTASEGDFQKIGIQKKIAKNIILNKNKILRNLENERTGGFPKGIGQKTWTRLSEYILSIQSAKIDTVVTTDIHRLVRLTNTLHGKTGLKKVEFSIKEIDDFDPFQDSIAFQKGNVTVFVTDVPKFRLGNEILGPYKKQKIKLSTAAAILLICKGRAELVE